jgi:predicted permease
MRSLRRFWRRLASSLASSLAPWAATRQDEERLRAEIEGHLALQTAENIRAGLPPAEARRQAALKFGGSEAMKETYREQRGLPSLERLIQDTRHALRRLRMAPAFTIATVMTLALGIGATTSIFTLVHAVLLKSLPVANPAELFRLGRESHCCYIGGYSQQGERSIVSYDLYKYLRDNTKGFAELAAFQDLTPILGVRRSGRPDAAQGYPGEFVSGNYFQMFGAGAYAGRMLTPADDQPNAPPVAVMSYRLWQERYGSDPSVIGAVFNLDDKPFTIIGIAPPGFFGDSLRNPSPDFFLPLNTEPYVDVEGDLRNAFQHWLELIGRTQPGANPTAIEAEMRVNLKQWLLARWGEMSANDRAKFPEQTLYLTPGGAGITNMRERYEHWLQILMMASGFVLLIVCANIANLMLVRGLERRRQTSLSVALGAPISRVVREPLLESILLSLFGGALGLAAAFAGTRLILQLAFPSLPGHAGVPISASPSMPVLLFAFLTSLLTGVAFGITPAWVAARVDPIEALRGSGRATRRAGSLSRKMLIAFQTALSLVLVTAAGLLTAALQRMENQDFGFELDRRIVATINPRLAGYRPDQLSMLYRRIRDSITNILGVSSVALGLYSPPGGGWASGVSVEGRPAPGPRDDNSSSWNRVTTGYFEAVVTPILRGRGISAQDTAESPKIAVVNETFARKFFPSEDPIGKHFGPIPTLSGYFEIAGVVRDARYFTKGLDQPTGPMYFTPEAQADYTRSAGALFLHDIVIAAKPGANVSAPSVLEAMASVDPNMPVISIRTLREQVASQFTQPWLIARLISFFGILSLLLAAIGLYGVTAYNAGCRTGEIGVRVALGANRGNIVRLVLRGAFVLILWGLLIGLPLTLAGARFLENQLYGMSPYDPVVVLTAVLALGLSALIASLIPALRASLISPLDALRAE